jgi:hypothetical protein
MRKDVYLIIAVVIAIGSASIAFWALNKQTKLTKKLEEERYGRLVAEESSQKSAAKLAVLENQIKAAGDKMAKMKDVLDQEKGVNSDLKSQYDKLTQAKAELEAKLQAAMEAPAAPAVETASVSEAQ